MNEEKQDYKLDPLWDKVISVAASGDNLGAVFLLKSLADKGVWQVLAQIGQLYESGGGNLEKNLDEANKWYRKAVFECDDPVAHLGLGRAYYNGAGGIEQDFSKALFHFRKAYLAHIPEAGIYLGIMTYNGVATERDVGEAKKYFQYAAENDFCLAYVYLARIYFFSGHILKAIGSIRKARSLLVCLAKVDPNDPRLMGTSK